MRTVSRILALSLSLATLGASCVPAASAQVLARPGWAGSGVSSESWWRRAVFYRIHPATFQDSTGIGTGDVAGIIQRLGYLQQLGVDAIILTPPFTPDDFGTLARKAADVHIRVLAEVHSTDPREARSWLNQGAAGLFLNVRGNTMAAMRDLRRASDSFPGERVLLATGVLPSNDGAQLSVTGNFSAIRDAASAMRQQLQAGQDAATTGAPLLELTGLAIGPVTPGGQQPITERALATMLLASRSAVIFDAGRELGLRSSDGKPVPMQWTPSNLTRDTPVATPTKPALPKSEVYGAYTPYIPPPPKTMLPTLRLPKVVDSEVPPPPDPNTLPGFTSGAEPTSEALNGTNANAAVEDADPNSLLNFYRHLIALHHDNGSIRNGSQALVDRDATNTLAWLRRAPAGSRTAASVVVACNLTAQPTELSLPSDFAQLRMRGGTLRPLLTASAGDAQAATPTIIPLESSDHMALPAYTVFLGELYHSGSEEAAPTTAHHSYRRRRHY